MKMTLIDCAIVFSVANIMFAGLLTHAPEPETDMNLPFCNPDKTAHADANTDPRCVDIGAATNPSTAPAQTPAK